MYLWTAPANGEATARRASGVTDCAITARRAAESLLRTGQAGSASIERAYTAIGAPALSLRYVRTGTGWSAHLSQAGQVVWTPFAEPELLRASVASGVSGSGTRGR